MSNLTKREIVQDIYRATHFPQKEIEATVQRTIDLMQQALAAGRNVEIRNFGVLEVAVRNSRVGRNPVKPDETIIIPRRAAVKFKPGKIMKQQLDEIDVAALHARRGKAELAVTACASCAEPLAAHG